MSTESKPLLPPHHLPVDHPGFRYPPSRNPYWKKLGDPASGLSGRVFFDNGTEEHQGEWRTLFPDVSRHAAEDLERKHGALEARKLHVEIGCNAGHLIVELARKDPEAAWIGMDWKFKVIFRAAEKGIKRGLHNLIFMRAKAERIHYMFGAGEIDHLYLYFPDPWPRKSQFKHRFITADRLRLVVAPLLKPGSGLFHIRTDHFGYFQWMEEHVAQVSDLFEVVERSTDRHAAHPDPTRLEIPDVTLFERIWIKQGIKINTLTLRRK